MRWHLTSEMIGGTLAANLSVFALLATLAGDRTSASPEPPRVAGGGARGLRNLALTDGFTFGTLGIADPCIFGGSYCRRGR